MEKVKLTLEEIVSRYNLIKNIQFEKDNQSLSKELKLKIIKMRIEYNKYKKQLDEDAQEFTKELVSERYKNLMNNPNKSEEQKEEFNQLEKSYNQDISEYMISRSKDIIEGINDWKFSELEYEEIIDLNSANDVEINGVKISAPDYLELIYDMLIEKEES